MQERSKLHSRDLYAKKSSAPSLKDFQMKVCLYVLKTIQSYMCLKVTNKNIVKAETHFIMYMLIGNGGRVYVHI